MPTKDDGLAPLLMTAMRRIKERLTDPAGWPNGPSLFECGVLWHVARAERPLLKDVAAALRVAPPTLTPIMNRLVATGLLRRKIDARDRRASRLTLTAKGSRTLDEGMRRNAARLNELLKVLTPKERRTFATLLQKLSS